MFAQIDAEGTAVEVATIEQAILDSTIAGELEVAKIWADKLCKLAPEAEHQEVTTVSSILSTFAKNGLHESVMAQCNRLAYALAAEHQIMVSSIHFDVDLQDGIVLFTLTLNTSEDKVQELDSMLGQRLFEQIPDYDPSKYWVGFAARSNHERQS